MVEIKQNGFLICLRDECTPTVCENGLKIALLNHNMMQRDTP